MLILAFMWSTLLGEALWNRIIVTPKEVRAVMIHRAWPAPREQVTHIRALRWSTVFYNHERDALLRMGSDLSRKQLLALGDELGATVWDHRAWLGVRELQHGVNITVNRVGIK